MNNLLPPLEALIHAVAQGDRAAFAELYGRTSAKLLGVVLRIVRERAAAEDVLQEVYLKVWQNAASYRLESGRPMTWLISIARYRAIDLVRSRRGDLASGLDDSEGYLAVPDPRDREQEMIDSNRLGLCLGKLDEAHRRCFLDAYHEGLSREELADRYARPVNTIKTWLHRAAASLRTCLDAA